MAPYLGASHGVTPAGVSPANGYVISTTEDSLNSSATPIAICGIALRLPGGISNPSQFWDFLINKGDARSLIPKSRFNAEAYYSKSGKEGYIKTQHGYFLDESVDIGALDTTFFSMGQIELERADPQQRLLLELTRECLESAGERDYRGSSTGTYIGSFGEDWLQGFSKDRLVTGMYKVTGYGDFVLSNRIAYEYDLKGPSMTVRTGCSAALIGLHEACLAIRAGECSAALVGGCNLITGPDLYIDMSDQGVLSPNGSSRSFDADADGYARGEAINMIYIKKLSDAIRDGNPIRAIIRGTSANADGKTAGLSVPNGDCHEAMIRHAYQSAGITDYSATGFVECHGTGTQTGDPIETNAIARVFGQEGVYIGSVKPNVGHSEGASGLTSVIKCVLALEHQKIPPNIKFDKPNPKIPFKQAKLQVPLDATQWPQGRTERASVNSFGFGGSNAHVILDSRRSVLGEQEDSQQAEALNQAQLLVFSANTTDSIQQQVFDYQNYLLENPSCGSDLSYTLGLRRQHLPHRAFSVVGDKIQPNNSAFIKAPSSQTQLAMIFTGQGAQWPQMGADLLASNAVFRASIQHMDKVLQMLPDPPDWSIMEELRKPLESSNLHKASMSQPLCTALQVALLDALADLGVQPCAVVGHSSGEMAAAYAAKRLTSNEAIVAAYYRGVVSGEVTDSGTMAAIGMGKDETSQFLVPGVVIACENSPSSVTISGDRLAVDDALRAIREARPGVLARTLKVDKAYHSHHMEQVGQRYQSLASVYVQGNPDVPDSAPAFFSSVFGKQLGSADLTDASYWRANLESPVLFNTAISKFVAYYKAGSSNTNLMFLEVGPHSALAGPLRQILSQTSFNCPYASCLSRGMNSSQSFLASIGSLWQNNVPIDFVNLTNRHGKAKVLTDLPTYPWNHDHNPVMETRITHEWRFAKFPKHELLGSRVSESTDAEPIWRNVLKLDHVPWVRDHNIKGDVIFPGAGYIGMVGEASRQIYLSNPVEGDYEGFAMKNVVIDTALVLSASKSTEVITTLKKLRLTDSLDSSWWEFVVSSYNGSSWIKHCTGRVSARYSAVSSLSVVLDLKSQKLPRKVNSAKFYQSWRNVGGNYGPYFRGLKDVSCATRDQIASATAVLSLHDDETEYSVHPTQIDFFLQLLCVAKTKGVGHEIDKMLVPTFIKTLEARKANGDIKMLVEASSTSQGGGSGSGEGWSNTGELVIQMEDVKFNALEGEKNQNSEDPHAGARLYWQADPDFMNLSALMRQVVNPADYLDQLHELTLLFIKDSLSQLEGIEPTALYLDQFSRWMREQPLPQTTKTASELLEELKGSTWEPMATGLFKVHEHIHSIYTGGLSPLEILLPNDTLTNIYNMIFLDRAGFFRSLGHSKPDLKVLEVGAGTGGTTVVALEGLRAPNGQPLYGSYTYTDISAGFFDAAKERFKGHKNIKFQTLDITKDPLGQGFEPESFDLIVGANVLHATPSLTETLSNARKLLKPDGRLYMEELCSDAKAINFVMGVLPGWWLGANDGRPNEPYVSPETWAKHLREAGFDGLEDVTIDGLPGCRYTAFMTARPRVDDQTSPNTATVLYDEESKDVASEVVSYLHQTGVIASLHELGCPLQPVQQDIVSVVDLRSPFFDGVTSEKYEAFQDLINHLSENNTGMFWLTRSCQIKSSDPRWAQVLGAFRTIRNELGVDIATCELQTTESECLASAIKVFRKFQGRNSNPNLRPEYEYAIEGTQVQLSRLYPVVINDELVQQQDKSAKAVYDLKVGSYGDLSTLHWVARPVRDLVGDEVEVDAKAVGMNFKDVLCAMGIVEAPASGIGLEASGTVKRVGPDVNGLQVGDRVFIMGSGCFSTGLVTSSNHCVKIPDGLDFEAAATMPCVFATVIYGLLDVGRLEEGETVLIHSACGGVGLSAIQVCNMVGAKIYCTVGNEDKVQYLEKNYGIPRERIFNSRDASFLPDLLKATGGRGADVVLNSLSGELLHASWDCVAPYGRMIEIGKRDLIGNGKLELNPFLLNRSYHGVDLGQIAEEKPRKIHRLLERIAQYYRQGLIQPINQQQAFTADKIQDCFRYMQKGQHIGKIVVSMDHAEALAGKLPATEVAFKHEASYVLVGGLGGLGRVVSSWAVEHGARSLVFLSRNAGVNADDEVFFDELRSQGCTVMAVKGNVTNISDVKNAIASAPSLVKGVLNMSMVLRDQNFLGMPLEDWTAVADPKVIGTWNLHNACQELGVDLDFFLLFSSISGLVGQKGQANYAGANAFLDSFVQYRHSQGLNASAIDVGVMVDNGYVAENDIIRERMELQGYYGIRTKQLLDAIAVAIGPSKTDSDNKPYAATFCEPSQFAIGLRSSMPLSDPSNHVMWKRDRRVAVYQNAEVNTIDSSSSKAGSSSALATFVTSATGDPSILNKPDAKVFVARQIAIKIQILLLRPVQDESEIDVNSSLQDVGLDSLSAIEMRRWWKEVFKADISVLEMLGMGSLLSLGERAIEGLKERFGVRA